LFGVDRGVLLGRRIDEFAGESGAASADRLWRSFVARGEMAGEFRLRRPDGRAHDVDYRASANFVPGRHLAILRDVTERKHNEVVQRYLVDAGAILGSSLDYEATLQQLASLTTASIADGCLIDLADGTRIRCAAAASADPMLGVDLGTIHSRQLDASVGLGHAVQRVFKRGGIESFRSPAQEVFPESFGAAATASDRSKTLATVLVPIRIHDKTLGVIAFFSIVAPTRPAFETIEIVLAEEVGRRVAFAAENARLYANAQDSVRARDDFISIASHELRTPLTTLQLQVQTLRRWLSAEGSDGGLAKRIDEKLETIERSTRRLDRLISELLDVARVMGGRIDLNLENVDLVSVVRDVMARVEDEAKRASVSLSLSGEASLNGSWDRLRLEEIVTNLVSNAIKYGGGKPVEISVESSIGFARLTVRDRGIGIAPENQARIFDRFERAVSAQHYGGFGLGLWIVRQFVEAMGGAIRVESQAGMGSTFSVELPLDARKREIAAVPQRSGIDAGIGNGERPA
jgi:signal transduction histidine kinase